ncbi:MAG: long-chain fatty acid--CoA ligase [Myxococcales bacterium FL481]|nr:MAG: long-chain fatty acid--CoA ligase [Myxococcales bacterium FL481]
MANESILDFVIDHATNRRDETAALTKVDGEYQPVTWSELWKRAGKIAAALVRAGIEPGDRVGVICHTRIEWVQIDLGILAAGGVTVPIYPSNLATDCQYVLEHSESVLVFCEDDEQTAKLREHEAQLEGVKRVVQITGQPDEDEWVCSMDTLIGDGQVDEAVLAPRRASLTRESILTIIYTAGTTGRPKGVVLTHGNMLYEGEAVTQIDIVRRDDVQLFFLPLAHVFAKVLEVSWFSVGYVMAFAEGMGTIRQNLAEVRPTFMTGVPRVFERFYSAVVDKGTAGGGLQKKLFLAALEMSQRNGEAELRGESLGLVDTIKFEVLKRVIFTKVGAGIQEILGGRMDRMLSGGAPLAQKVAWFFRDAGLTLVEGYGLTETSAGTCVNRPSLNLIGTVGPALPKTEVKIAEDGEVLVRGPGVMREYWKNQEATDACLIDGWFHTGDIGELDAATGALRITDRKKDILVTAGGKNVAPQKLENLFKTYKLISQVVVIGDRRKFLSALVTLDADELQKLATRFRLEGDYATLSQRPEINKAVAAIFEQGNQQLASFETIKKFKILDKDLSVEDGTMTPKLSVRRKVVIARHQASIDEFYGDEQFR